MECLTLARGRIACPLNMEISFHLLFVCSPSFWVPVATGSDKPSKVTRLVVRRTHNKLKGNHRVRCQPGHYPPLSLIATVASPSSDAHGC
jgi:hypothetical protein